jgi:predicted ATPase/class 3 adenylate cyclase
VNEGVNDGPTHSPSTTFLFTDIVDSTPRWEEHGDAMARALSQHDALLDAAIVSAGGRVLKHTGDGLVAVFFDAPSALHAAISAQRALGVGDWTSVGGLEVRMGMHTGDAHERAGDYFGPVMNRAARVMNAANGGQIVCSEECVRAAGADLPDGAVVVDCGEHRLKGVGTPVRLFAVAHPELVGDHPPLRSLNVLLGNLPVPATPLIGRDDDVRNVVDLVARHDVVTIVGPGGVGKTRLALETAHAVAMRFPDGAWFLDLSSAPELGDLTEEIGSMLGVQQRQGQTMRETLRDVLAARSLLVVIDNCEHVIDAVATFIEDAATATATKVLATSREPLHVAGERRYRLGALQTPTEAGAADADDVASCASVRLFVERGRAVCPDLVLAPADVLRIGEICDRLDGLPLAIELAAARLESLSVDALVERLGERLSLLHSASRRGVARQRALEATLDWSFDLLDDDERHAFCRLGVFTGPFSLDAAEAVIGAGWTTAHVADVVDRLVVKSMLHSEPVEARLRLLETVREYTRHRLESAGDLAATEADHARHYAHVARVAEGALGGADEAGVIDRLDADLANLRAAFGWLLAHEPATALDMASDLYSFWIGHDLLHEGLAWLTATTDAPAPVVARALANATVCAFFVGENDRAAELASASIAASEAAGEHPDPKPLNTLALLALYRGRIDEGLEFCERAVVAARDLGGYEAVLILSAIGVAITLTGDVTRGVALCEEAARASVGASPSRRAASLMNLAIALQPSDPARAVTVAAEVVEVADKIRSQYFLGFAWYQTGIALRAVSRDREALHAFGRALPMLRNVGFRNEVATTLEQTARLLVNQEPAESVTLYGAAAALREVISLPGIAAEQRSRERALLTLREILGSEAFAGAWSAGTAMSLDEAVDVAEALTLDLGAEAIDAVASDAELTR